MLWSRSSQHRGLPESRRRLTSTQTATLKYGKIGQGEDDEDYYLMPLVMSDLGV